MPDNDDIDQRITHAFDQAYAEEITRHRAIANDPSVWWYWRWVNRRAADLMETDARGKPKRRIMRSVRRLRRRRGER